MQLNGSSLEKAINQNQNALERLLMDLKAMGE